jgi:uncharacterized protein YcbK (DUF882 family)
MNENKSPQIAGAPGADEEPISRRRFLRMGVLAAVAATSPRVAFGSSRNPERSLAFYNTHTGENLETTYWSNGNYLPEPLKEIDLILRDHRTGEVQSMDPRLLDLLFALRGELDTNKPFHIISGYRSLATNSLLRRTRDGVATKSLHLDGKAADIRVPGIAVGALREAAVALQGGGVGYYPRSNFVHVDIGRVRYW